MSKEIKVKRLSECSASEGLQILSKLNRAIETYANDEEFMSKLRAEFTKYYETSPGEAKFLTLMGIIDLIANSAPELIFELIAIMCDEDVKDISEANAIDVVDAVLILGEDIKLMDFLSKRLSSETNGSTPI